MNTLLFLPREIHIICECHKLYIILTRKRIIAISDIHTCGAAVKASHHHIALRPSLIIGLPTITLRYG